jgi:anaerobic dimethyl sulfoxide reductase subunit C
MAIMNVRSSWLSREILFTVLFFVTVGWLAALQWFAPGHTRLKGFLGWLAILIGSASILCMSMIYLLPTQPMWNSILTLLSFFASSLLLGVAAMFAMLVMDLRFSEVREGGDQNARILIIKRPMIGFAILTVLTAGLIVVLNAYQIALLGSGDNLARISLELLLGLYRPLFIARLVLLFAGVAWLIVTVGLATRKGKPVTELIGHVYVSFLLLLVGEILGRFLFYAMHVRLGL